MPLRPATEEEIEFLTKGQSRPAPEGLIPILEESEISDESWLDNPGMAARFIADGVTFGFSDEMASAVTAAISKLSGSPKTYGEIYESTVNSLESSRNEYRQKNQAAALGLEVAGGLATLPLTAGGTIAVRGGSLLKGFAPKIADTVASFFPKVSQVVGSNMAGRAALTATKAATPLTATGALAGVGYAQQGDDLYDAAVDGALFNVIGGAILNGFGSVIKGATSRKISAELGEGDEFIPIIASTDGSLSNIYKNIIGNIPLARGTLNRQMEKLQKPLNQKVEVLEQRLFAREGIKDVKQVENYLSQSERLVRNTYDEIKAKVSSGSVSQEVKDRIAAENKRLQVVQSARINRVDEIIANRESNFRASIVRSSMPSTSLKKDIKQVLEENSSMQESYGELGNLWKDKGFEVINKRTFRINSDQLTSGIVEEVGDELKDFQKLYGGRKLKIEELIPQYLDDKIINGRISGENLSALRTSFSRASYRFANDVNNGQNAQKGFVLGKIVSKINDTIESQLTPKDLQKFKADQKSYKTYIALGDAVRAASKKPGIRGSFNAGDWLNSLSRNQRKDFGKGTATFQKEADVMGDLAQRRENILQRGKDVTQKRIQIATQIAMDDVQKETQKAAANLVTDASAAISQKRQNIELATELTENRNALQALDNILNSSDKNSNIRNLVSFIGLSGVSAYTGSIASSAALIGAGKFAASPLGQRIVAGQTQTQNAIFNAAQRAAPTVQSARELISRGIISQDAATIDTSEQDLIARRGTDQAKAAAFQRLTQNGKIEELRRRNYSGYKNLKEAFDKITNTQ